MDAQAFATSTNAALLSHDWRGQKALQHAGSWMPSEVVVEVGT